MFRFFVGDGLKNKKLKQRRKCSQPHLKKKKISNKNHASNEAKRLKTRFFLTLR